MVDILLKRFINKTKPKKNRKKSLLFRKKKKETFKRKLALKDWLFVADVELVDGDVVLAAHQQVTGVEVHVGDDERHVDGPRVAALLHVQHRRRNLNGRRLRVHRIETIYSVCLFFFLWNQS